MSRRQGRDQRQYSQNYYSDSSRNWSDEAVRGSWDSNYQRTTSANTSPRDQSQAWSRPSPQAYDRSQNNVNQWLGQQYQNQYTNDHSMVADTVSDFTTPTTSPAFSDSPTFPSRTQHTPAYQTQTVGDEFLAPPSRTSLPHRQYDSHYHSGAPSSSRGSISYNQSVDYRRTESRSTDQDLRGVGSFADNDRSRREVKYKPLGNWFGLWLPPTE
ncbi:hypothetical protein HYE67_008387 [Fusarium culmorum]|uniref:Uncharacterized protein n=1 Tax=Fusarium culmorum TaxID=5516 RepID=A0A2T4HAZ0_FUSCU|nr:hypothetical protein FCULG_00003081 [Fusarium culmorum]QPC66156.1 hypothetical protein HYE67_008387 [Fusarium culmorum]